jgi:DNA polymerase III subunit delta
MPPGTSNAAAPVLLVFGEDEFAVKERGRQVYTQWCQETGGMDHEIIDAQTANAGEALQALSRLREAIQTLPFFGASKVVWLRNCNFLGEERTAQAGDVVETLADLTDQLKGFAWDNVRLLITAGKTDRRKAFYKTVEKIGAVEGYSAPSLDDKDWVARMEEEALAGIRGWNKSISEEALGELAHNVGPNTQQMKNEVEKLCLYVGDKTEIEAHDVRSIVSRNKQARAFALADALGDRDLGAALKCLDEEFWTLQFDKKKSAIGLLAGLISKVRAMILLKELQREGLVKEGVGNYGTFKAQLERIPPEKLPEERQYNPRAIHPFVLFNSLPHARKYALDELVRAMQAFLECNRKLVSSQLEEKLVMQQMIVQIIRGHPAERTGPARSDLGTRTTAKSI